MAILANSAPQAHSAGHDHEAHLREEHLMLDPRPRGEMNAMVMESMQVTSWKFWVVAAILAVTVIICLGYYWGYMIINGLGVAGVHRPILWWLFLVNTVFCIQS